MAEVDRAAQPCRYEGCKFHQALEMLKDAKAIIDGREEMSQAIWCDQGEHSFSARDPKAEHWDRRVTNADGEKETIPWDVCGPCMAKIDARLGAMEEEIKHPKPPAIPGRVQED